MKESEDGEFVRHEDVEQKIETNKQMFRSLWNDYVNGIHENKQTHALVEHLQDRVNAMFCVIIIMTGLAVGKLIGWSFGL